MADLQNLPAKRCLTVASFLVHDGKVLLVKHKKLGFWLAPGGHVEPDELPHKAAVREFWEETGVKVEVVDTSQTADMAAGGAEYLPHPFLSNLHWVSEENYQARTSGAELSEKTKQNWGKGCEQHLCFLYLVKPTGSLEFIHNEAEALDISWFTLAEVQKLDTVEDIKAEVAKAFELMAARGVEK